MSHQTKHLYEFGPFRLDAGERLLLREGESVPLTPKAFDLLLALVEHHGHLLEKDELMKLVWPDTFVEEANLSSNISLIRKALGDRENGQKYIETVPRRGYRFVAIVKETEVGQVERAEATSRRQVKGALLALVVLVIAFGGIAFGLYKFAILPQSKSSGAEPEVIPLTSLPGQEFQPAFSPDGNQIAFVWRKDKDSGSDIYIKLANDETSRQLTKSPADELSPAWSPDSRYISFDTRVRGNADIFVINAEGGKPRALTTEPSDDVTSSEVVCAIPVLADWC